MHWGAATALTVGGLAIVGGTLFYLYRQGNRRVVAPTTSAPGAKEAAAAAAAAPLIPSTGIGIVDLANSVIGEAITQWGGKAIAEAGKYAIEGARRYSSTLVGKEQKAA